MSFGMEGPKMSRSSRPTRSRRSPALIASANARFTVPRRTSHVARYTRTTRVKEVCAAHAPATVLFPTPPFPLATTSTLFTCGIGRLATGPPLRGSEGGAGAAARYSMGLVIFSGVLVGTMFTLFVVPMFYTFIAAREIRHEGPDDLPQPALQLAE